MKLDASEPSTAAQDADTEIETLDAPNGKTDVKKTDTTATAEAPAEATSGDPEQAASDPAREADKKAENSTEISFSGGLYGFMKSRNMSLAFTSYQTGNLYILGHGLNGNLSLHQSRYPQAMG
ncbi:MAG: hypothetical protein AAFY82_04115, partial [Pseudomonadota bacterium]